MYHQTMIAQEGLSHFCNVNKSLLSSLSTHISDISGISFLILSLSLGRCLGLYFHCVSDIKLQEYLLRLPLFLHA